MSRTTCNIFFAGFPHAAVTRRRATDYSRTRKAVYHGRNNLFLGLSATTDESPNKTVDRICRVFFSKKKKARNIMAPSQRVLRSFFVTGAIITITIGGSLYGAELKTKQEKREVS
jgi:hypothetical protein